MKSSVQRLNPPSWKTGNMRKRKVARSAQRFIYPLIAPIMTPFTKYFCKKG